MISKNIMHVLSDIIILFLVNGPQLYTVKLLAAQIKIATLQCFHNAYLHLNIHI
jgi:hypothetical protein